jgi:hypothetical protein
MDETYEKAIRLLYSPGKKTSDSIAEETGVPAHVVDEMRSVIDGLLEIDLFGRPATDVYREVPVDPSIGNPALLLFIQAGKEAFRGIVRKEGQESRGWAAKHAGMDWGYFEAFCARYGLINYVGPVPERLESDLELLARSVSESS